MSFRYSVTVTFPSQERADAYIAWLRGGHMLQVPVPTLAHPPTNTRSLSATGITLSSRRIARRVTVLQVIEAGALSAELVLLQPQQPQALPSIEARYTFESQEAFDA